ncbi:MAG: alpha/beta fold hydrolase [Elusimicrobia bacterium]|nr:alpha/beta fold hydrolase [Elusimicrobiota bacterium]
MSAGIVLVHGFSGSPDDLLPLSRKLAAVHGDDSVTRLRLPGHGGGQTPSFDQAGFIKAIADAVEGYRREGRALVLLGHSTGGILALEALADSAFKPALLILASVPKTIGPSHLERWARHRPKRSGISFLSVAQMVSLINAVGSRRAAGKFPVVVLHGADDDLVPSEEAFAWARDGFERPGRAAIVPSAGHDLFRGENHALAVDLVIRAVADAVHAQTPDEERALGALAAVEPDAARFLTLSPSSCRHMARCPSAQRAAGMRPGLTPVADNEPVFANVEITTRCNLRCAYCARTLAAGPEGVDMDRETFGRVLGLLPHAYRITLVGLGEPLLHPQVVDLVAAAAAQGRRTSLVTNAMLLEPSLARGLLQAGLESITFSIDAPDPRSASEVRPGTDLERVIKNIKAFVSASRGSRPISTAVFSAVSAATVPYFEELLDLIAGLGVQGLMLTDLNFAANEPKTLWRNHNRRVSAAIRRGISRAFRAGMPVLSVRGIEEFGLWKRYDEFLLLPPSQLYSRSSRHAWCFSPWQTVPIGVRGDVTLCDCQPNVPIGNLLRRPFAEIWNAQTMTEHRSRMLGADPPEACRGCPRF